MSGRPLVLNEPWTTLIITGLSETDPRNCLLIRENLKIWIFKYRVMTSPSQQRKYGNDQPMLKKAESRALPDPMSTQLTATTEQVSNCQPQSSTRYGKKGKFTMLEEGWGALRSSCPKISVSPSTCCFSSAAKWGELAKSNRHGPVFYLDMQISWPDSGSPPIRLSDS